MPPPVPLLVALLLLAVGLGGRRALLVAAAAVGSLHATVEAPTRLRREIERDRPLTVTARVASHPVDRGDAWTVPLRVSSVRQGNVVHSAADDVLLALADGMAPPPAGATIRATGYLSFAAVPRNDVPARPSPPRLRVKSAHFVVVERAPGLAWRVSSALRRRADAVLGRGPGAALARALVLGDTGDVPASWQRGLRRCGLTHLLSVSGVHVGLLLGAVYAATAFLPRRARFALALLVTLGYGALVGPLPPLLRALGMGWLAVLAVLTGRTPVAANALAVVTAALLLAQPRLLADLGFQLSVSATAALVTLAGPLARRWSALPRSLATALAATIAAQIGSLPFALTASPLISPVAPLWNLVALPWAAVTLAAGFAVVAVGMIAPTLGAGLHPLLDALAYPVAWSDAPRPELFAPVALPLAPLAAAALALLVLAAAWWPRRGSLLLAVGLLAALAGGARPAPEVVLLDVGQGDAVLLRDRRGAVLIDGGGWPRGDIAARVLAPALGGLGVRSLDVIVLSHPDRDHCGGLVDLVSYLPIGELWSGPGWFDEGCGRELLLRRGPRLRVLWRGDRRHVGGWRFDVLHPGAGERPSDNERSLVLRAEHGRFRVLLTGDSGFASEQLLLARRPDLLRADLLKVAHHGSRNSTSARFLELVRPRLAVVSSGSRNPYGHPSPVLLARLDEQGVPLLRTDRHGMLRVRIRPDGGMRLHVAGDG